MRRPRCGSTAAAAAVAAAMAAPVDAQEWWDQQQAESQQESAGVLPKGEKPTCQEEKFHIRGKHSSSQVLVPTGWLTSYSSEWARHPDDNFTDVLVENDTLIAQMGSRAYFAQKCTAGKYDYKQYMNSNLLGKVMRFSVDITGAGCGCNAAFYMTSMGHNDHVSECFDYYCDANNVCGESCAEIDIMEANQHAFHITLHTSADPYGTASGFGGGGQGWNGPRNWTRSEYGKGRKCIDTRHPFDVAVSFPLRQDGVLEAMQVTLSQPQRASKCDLQMRVDNYLGMEEITNALKEGMTPIVSYWADDDMLWLDGQGDDLLGPCEADLAEKCADSVKFYNFSIDGIPRRAQKGLEKRAREQDAKMEKLHPTEPPHNWWDDQQGDTAGTDEWYDGPSTNSTTGWWENPATWGQPETDSTESTSSTTGWWETTRSSSSTTGWWETAVVKKNEDPGAPGMRPAGPPRPAAAPLLAGAALALGVAALVARGGRCRGLAGRLRRADGQGHPAELALPLHHAPAALELPSRPSSEGLLLELGPPSL